MEMGREYFKKLLETRGKRESKEKCKQNRGKIYEDENQITIKKKERMNWYSSRLR